MAEKLPEGRPIPLIQVWRPDEEMSVDVSVDEMLQREQDELDQEKRNMDLLCDQVQCVGLQQQNVDPVDEIPVIHKFTYIILADYSIDMDRFQHGDHTIRWVLVRSNTILETETVINNFLQDPHPKGLVIHCFTRFFLELKYKLDDVMTAITNIATKMKNIFIHNLVFSTSPFYPCMEKKWPQVAAFNLFTRNTNIAMGKTPLGLHKSLLRSVKSLGKMAVKGDMFQEFREGSGVGASLTHEGVEKICHWLGQHCVRGMETTVDNYTSLTPNESVPECLSWTPGYKGDLMVRFIRQMGTYKGLPRYSSNSGKYQRQQYQRNKDQRRDTLRPSLASIGRRPSTSASSSSASSIRSSSVATRVEGGDLADQVRLVKLERDNQDLRNVMQTLKDKAEEERRDRRRGEENLTNTIQRLFSEMEWMSRSRQDLSTKLIKAEQELLVMKEDRNYLSDEMSRKKKKANKETGDYME